MSRALADSFKESLLRGCLKPLLEEVKSDNTLIMELRGDYVDIYYRGGALFTVKNDNSISYNADYWKNKKKYERLVSNPSIEECVRDIALYKNQMDYHRATAGRELEKQGQQMLILENNILSGKNGVEESQKKQTSTGDYFIVDMEYAYKNKGIDARFDAIGIRWPSLSHKRKVRENLGISFLELKYYDNSMGGKAGIEKHISDFLKFTQDNKYKNDYIEMCKDMEKVFRQKCELGLIPGYTSHLDMTKDDYKNITINPNEAEMIFIFINRDPDSSKAPKEIDKCIRKYGVDKMRNIYVSSSSDMGYVMFRYEEKGKKDRYISIKEYAERYGFQYE